MPMPRLRRRGPEPSRLVAVGWRSADEALLSRLEDEAIFETIWEQLAPLGTPAPHPRAAGVLVELRRTRDGVQAIQSAAKGHFAPAFRAMAQPDLDTLTPALAHHLALIWTRIGTSCARSLDPAVRASAAKAHLRAIAMWLWLADEGDYLSALAQTVIDGKLSATETTAAAHGAAFELLHQLGDTARAGARDLSPESELAASVLARVGEACLMVRCSAATERAAVSLAQRERDRAVEDAVGRVEDALEEATTRGADTDELVPLLFDAVAVWRWADRDVHVERFLVRVITPTLWDHYRAKRWDTIRALLRPLSSPIESLARRCEADRAHLAYAAPCAQMLVFQAEVCRAFDEQLAIVERALRICSTHRNALLVCADLLVERGLRRLDAAKPWETGDALMDAERDIRRANELYPQLKRLEGAKRRLAAKGIDIDA